MLITYDVSIGDETKQNINKNIFTYCIWKIISLHFASLNIPKKEYNEHELYDNSRNIFLSMHRYEISHAKVIMNIVSFTLTEGDNSHDYQTN